MKITKDDLNKIWSEVKLNRVKLASCSGPHDFSVDVSPQKNVGKKWQCTKCLGTIDSINREWYLLGLTHVGVPNETKESQG